MDDVIRGTMPVNGSRLDKEDAYGLVLIDDAPNGDFLRWQNHPIK